VPKTIAQFGAYLSAVLFPVENQVLERKDQESYFRIIEQARRDWQDAIRRFEQATDPDLIDSAIFAIESAEKRYIYLLKNAVKEKENWRLSS